MRKSRYEQYKYFLNTYLQKSVKTNWIIIIFKSIFHFSVNKKLKMELALNSWPETFTYLHSVWLECLANLQWTELCGF